VPENERLEKIRKDVADRGIEFFFAQFVDLHARPSAKLIPAAHLDDLVTDGAGFAGFAAGDIGQAPSDPDIAAIPDLDSFTPVPFEPTVARFACDITVDGEPWPYDPRTILKNQLARAREAGFEFKIGLELEYFLLRRGDDGGLELADPLDDLPLNGTAYALTDPEGVLVAAGASGVNPLDLSEEGYVRHPAIPAGVYRLELAAPGYDTHVEQTGVKNDTGP
jgi:glutamine synthetase